MTTITCGKRQSVLSGNAAIAPAINTRSKRHIVIVRFSFSRLLPAFRWFGIGYFFPFFFRRCLCFLLRSDELERIRNDRSRRALLAFAVGVGIGLQTAIERERAAFPGILRNDLGIASEDCDAEPIGDRDFFAVRIALLTVAGNRKVEHRDIAVGEAQCDLKDKFAVFEP